MKGKKICAFALASLLVLSGCSSDVVKDGDKYVVASINGENILADDVYESLMSSNSGSTVLFDYVLQQLIDSKFPVNDDMKENASQLVETVESNYEYSYGDSYMDYLESDLASSGYEDLESYEKSLIETLQYSEFLKQYVKDHFDTVYDDYYQTESPRILSIIKVAMEDVDNPTDDESAKKVEIEKLLKTSKTFGEIASQYSDDDSSSAKGNIGIIDSTSELASTYGDDFEDAALKLKDGETTAAIKGDDGYYYIHCETTDKETIKNELTAVDLDSPLLVYDSYMVYLAFETYEITYNNDKSKELIEKVIKEALEFRDESRGEQ